MSKTLKYRTCHLCEAMCGIEIELQNNEPIKIRGDKKDPFSRGHICPKAVALIDIHKDPDRLKRPVKKTANGWKEIDWQTAFDEISEKVLDIQKQYSKDAIAMYNGNPTIHNLGATLFVPQFLRALKTKNRFSATSVDQLSHHLAAHYMFGNGNILPVPDIDHTDFWLILGGNPMVSNGSIMTAPDIGNRMKDIINRDGKIVVVDPRYTETAERGTKHLFIKPGTDVWLLLAMINEIINNGYVSLGHLDKMLESNTVSKISELVSFCTIKLASEHTGISERNIKRLAHSYATAKSAVCYGRLGVSTVKYGSLSQWAVNALNILTGNLDKKGGAMFPAPAFDSVAGKQMSPKFGRWKSRIRNLPEYGGELPSATLAEEILTPGKGQIKALFTNCGNPVLSTPNGQQLDKALDSLEFIVSIDIYINETTSHADYILPPAAGLEVAHFDIGFNNLAIRNTVKYSDPIIPKEEGTLYDYQIFQGLIKAIQKDELPKDPTARQNMEMMYHITPQMMLDKVMSTGRYNLTVDELRKHPHGIDLGALTPCIEERIITPDKNIDLLPKIYIQEIQKVKEEKPTDQTKLDLIGRRHLRSNNSWMHNSHRLVKGPKRCTALIHPDDAEKRGISNGDVISVSSRVGTVDLPAEVTKTIAKGVISIPHGWGHNRKGVKLSVAQEHAGVSLNDLTDEMFVEELTGVTVLSAIPVDVVLSSAL